MFKLGTLQEDYLKDKLFIDEALLFKVTPSVGAVLVGIKREQLTQAFEIHRFVDMKLGRQSKNRNESLIGGIFTVHPSVNHFVTTLSKPEQVRFMNEVVAPAAAAVNPLIDKLVKARSGADGAKKLDAHVVSVDFVHMFSREGEVRVHVHKAMKRTVRLSDSEKQLSGDFRPLYKTGMEKINHLFQFWIAANAEKHFGVKMDIELKDKQAAVVGMVKTHDKRRRQEAEAYIEKVEQKTGKTIKRTPVAIAHALQNTRPEKKRNELPEPRAISEKTGAPVAQKEERPMWATLIDSLIKAPLQVYKAAYVASRRGETVKVSNVAEFIADASKPSRASSHKAAVRAVRRTKCESFSHALTVAERAFKASRVPKLQLPKNTRVKVHAKDIKTAEERKNLEALSKKHGWDLRVYGVVQEQVEQKKQRQSL